MSLRRIVIVNLTRFGDLLQTSPTIAALRAQHPDAAITIVAERNFADVCDGIPGIARVYRLDLDHLGMLLLDGGSGLLESYRYVEEVVRELRAERFELALNFSSSRMTAVFMGLLGVPDTRGWMMTADGMRTIRDPWARLFATMCLHRHVATFNLVDYYRAMAGAQGPGQELCYVVEAAAQARADTLLAEAGLRPAQPLVAMQLGASRASRQWRAEAFAELGRRLVRGGHGLMLVGGVGDRALAREVALAVGAGVVDTCGRTNVAELGGLLRRAAALVTGDTGPMHMAAAVQTPVVGLFFGPASPFDTGPYGADHVLLHTGASCAPCNHTVTCLNPFCRDDITPELVEGAVRARLGADWAGLDRLARTMPQVRIYRTGFDAHGLYDCTPLGAPPPRPMDELRRAYRATWMAELLQVPVGRPHTGTTAPDGFRALAVLSWQGAATARRLAVAAGASHPSIEEIERLGRALERGDEKITEHGFTHAETGVLTQMFRFGKENIEGEDVAALATETAELYRLLAVEAELMAGLLGGHAGKEREHDAHLHQRA
jgi:ADP-heptose:LPS heptosyltransferase